MIGVEASGARNRISTFGAGIFLFLLVVFGDFDWRSVKPSALKRMPKSETFVMIATVALVLITHNLAVGGVGGVLVASVLLVRRVAHFVLVARTVSDAADAVIYSVTGELFFASSNDLTTLFSYSEDPERVVVDLTGSHIWDASIVAALDAIETKYTALGKTVEIIGMNDSSQRMRGGVWRVQVSPQPPPPPASQETDAWRQGLVRCEDDSERRATNAVASSPSRSAVAKPATDTSHVGRIQTSTLIERSLCGTSTEPSSSVTRLEPLQRSITPSSYHPPTPAVRPRASRRPFTLKKRYVDIPSK